MFEKVSPGFDHLYIHQIGPDQEAYSGFTRRDHHILPDKGLIEAELARLRRVACATLICPKP
jgi:hypothetical protein